jgi:hypothetical protein
VVKEGFAALSSANNYETARVAAISLSSSVVALEKSKPCHRQATEAGEFSAIQD